MQENEGGFGENQGDREGRGQRGRPRLPGRGGEEEVVGGLPLGASESLRGEAAVIRGVVVRVYIGVGG